MARNKYPEETVKKILEVSMQLFIEKGYENTSIQDIIDHLGGLSKGAIYHHFKSKEEIMIAAMSRQSEAHSARNEEIRIEKNGMSGLQKLQQLFYISINSPMQDAVFKSAPNMLNNPKMLALQLTGIMKEAVPQFVQPVIEQGIADGSIKTQYPKQLAEVILLLVNLWLVPMVFDDSPEEMHNRILLFRQILQGIGADFMDEELISKIERLNMLYKTNG